MAGSKKAVNGLSILQLSLRDANVTSSILHFPAVLRKSQGSFTGMVKLNLTLFDFDLSQTTRTCHKSNLLSERVISTNSVVSHVQ